MPNTQPQNFVDTNIPTVNIEDLISQYDIARLKLHQCALYEAGDNLDQNTKMADNEYLYLSKQEEILSAVAATPLKSKEDIKSILRLWQKETIDTIDDMSAADDLVMALCRHFDVVV